MEYILLCYLGTALEMPPIYYVLCIIGFVGWLLRDY